jgi:hypothetical protein
MPDAPTLAVDLGGTRMRAAVISPDGELQSRRTEPTPQDAACPDALMALVGDVLDGGEVSRAVIGVPDPSNTPARGSPWRRQRGHEGSLTHPNSNGVLRREVLVAVGNPCAGGRIPSGGSRHTHVEHGATVLTRLLTQVQPPWAATKRRTRERPMPVPGACVSCSSPWRKGS